MRASKSRGAARVLHIAESAYGGVGTYLNEIIPALLDEGRLGERRLETRVLLPSTDVHMLRQVSREHISGYARNGRSISSLVWLAVSSFREVRRFKPHIVHLHSTMAGAVLRIPLWLLRLVTGAPLVVYSPHGWAFQIDMSSLKRRVAVLTEVILAKFSTAIVTLSLRETKECVSLGFPDDRLIHIFNGISSEGVEPLPAVWNDDRVKALFIGRFDRQKGLDILFDAASRSTEEIAVRCAGGSVVNDTVLPTAPTNVEMLGWMDAAGLRGHIQSADVVVVPSRWEGFGLVAVEAMRDSTMVIASNVGGLPEVVRDGTTGRLVPANDAEALRDALLRDTQADRKQMGKEGRARFLRHFTAKSSAANLIKLYQSVIEGKGVKGNA